jgi:hypothetical protein
LFVKNSQKRAAMSPSATWTSRRRSHKRSHFKNRPLRLEPLEPRMTPSSCEMVDSPPADNDPGIRIPSRLKNGYCSGAVRAIPPVFWGPLFKDRSVRPTLIGFESLMHWDARTDMQCPKNPLFLQCFDHCTSNSARQNGCWFRPCLSTSSFSPASKTLR